MAETRDDRIGLIATLANLPVHPESVSINFLVQVEGTPLAGIGRLAKLDGGLKSFGGATPESRRSWRPELRRSSKN